MKKCKIVLHILMISAISMFSLVTITQAETVVLAVDADYRPNEIDPPENGLRGFDVEVVEAAFERVGIKAEMKFLPWSRGKSMTKLGKFTGLFTCAYRPEREQYFLFSDKISQATAGFWMRRQFDGLVPESMQDVRGLKTGGILENSTLKSVQDVNPDTLRFRTIKLAVQNLIKGVFDYFYQIKETTGYTIKLMGVSGELKFSPIKEKLYVVCFSKKWPGIEGLMARFNRGLAAVKADGTYDAIHDKYR